MRMMEGNVWLVMGGLLCCCTSSVCHPTCDGRPTSVFVDCLWLLHSMNELCFTYCLLIIELLRE